MNRFFRGVFVCTVALVGSLSAATLVVPGFDTSTPGNTENGYPFNIQGVTDTPVNAQRYQQIYDALQFGGTFGFIDEIRFRPDEVSGAAFSATLSNIQIILSTTSATPGSPSTTFDNNLGASQTVVFSGALTLSSNFTGPVGGPKDFDIIIHLTTPFYYDPGQGNLIMQVKNFGGGVTTQFDAEQGTTVMQRVENVDGNANGTTGIVGVTVNGLVTQFEFVPEPASIALFGVGLIPLVYFARRRRNR